MICTQNFGFLSDFWVKGQGVNQGDPLSPSIYLLSAEIMANKIRDHPGIKGICINDIEYLISQFADDTDLFLSFEQETLTNVFNVLANIETNTGLKVSYDKTTLYRIGSLAKSDARLITPKGVNWSNDFINTLGVTISADKRVMKSNFSMVIAKMKTVANMWYYRNLTLLGKVLLINSLMSSLFVYKMQVLPLISDQEIHEIEAIMKEFLWKGRKEKISLSILKAGKYEGGVGLVDIKAKHKALLFNNILDAKKDVQIKNLVVTLLGESAQNDNIWEFNMNMPDSKKTFRGEGFWPSLLHHWHDFNHHDPQNADRCAQTTSWL